MSSVTSLRKILRQNLGARRRDAANSGTAKYEPATRYPNRPPPINVTNITVARWAGLRGGPALPPGEQRSSGLCLALESLTIPRVSVHVRLTSTRFDSRCLTPDRYSRLGGRSGQ